MARSVGNTLGIFHTFFLLEDKDPGDNPQAMACYGPKSQLQMGWNISYDYGCTVL